MRLLFLVLSWSWILPGIWWFFRPAGIKRRFEKRYRKSSRWLLLVVLAVIAGVLFSAGRHAGGILGVVLAALGILAVFKGLLVVRGKVSDTALDWWSAQPTWVYRASAAGLLLLGLLAQWSIQ